MVTIRIELKNRKIQTNEQKEAFARSVSGCFSDNYPEFKPYRPNEHDFDFWTLDMGNDWKIQFITENVIEFRHRYSEAVGLSCLIAWAMYQQGVEYEVVERL